MQTQQIEPFYFPLFTDTHKETFFLGVVTKAFR